ncbi:jg7444 [Pararge aegeria aegeria]|uniref:Jg7444 protein n=1 Tax=Pararge aegeria aegeria TaxID=348720 RepID=A0A8S4S198_9NEOP|nr:jg7444 [Pararge aegeria aegeria]
MWSPTIRTGAARAWCTMTLLWEETRAHCKVMYGFASLILRKPLTVNNTRYLFVVRRKLTRWKGHITKNLYWGQSGTARIGGAVQDEVAICLGGETGMLLIFATVQLILYRRIE